MAERMVYLRVNTYSKPSQGGYNDTINTRSTHNETLYPGLSHGHRHRPNAGIFSVSRGLMMIENFKALTRWTLPDSYGGAHWDEYFVFLGQNRDSDSLTRSNFICGLEALGGESETVIVVREGHWAVGWVEWIAIHESNIPALEQADSIVCALEDYPVVNEDHWSELEWNEAADYWERMRVRDRMEYCERAGVSIFAARRDYLPQDDSGYLLELLRG